MIGKNVQIESSGTGTRTGGNVIGTKRKTQIALDGTAILIEAQAQEESLRRVSRQRDDDYHQEPDLGRKSPRILNVGNCRKRRRFVDLFANSVS